MTTFNELLEALRRDKKYPLEVTVHHGEVVGRELLALLKRVWKAGYDAGLSESGTAAFHDGFCPYCGNPESVCPCDE